LTSLRLQDVSKLINNVLASRGNSKDRSIGRNWNKVDKFLVSVKGSSGSIDWNVGSVNDGSHWFLGGLSKVGPVIDSEEGVDVHINSVVIGSCVNEVGGPLGASNTSNNSSSNVGHILHSEKIG